MKLGWIVPILLLAGLLAAPNASFAAASDAAQLWWTRVLPSLLPYLIAASLLERSGILKRLPKKWIPPALWLFGALGGYPVGARLCARLSRDGVLTEDGARRAAPFCNLPNPVFLLSVVSFGIFESGVVAAPLLIGVYGAALIGLVPLFRLRFRAVPDSPVSLCASDLPEAIESGMRAILNVGGCLLFASVLGALLQAAGLERLLALLFGLPEATVHALLLGLFEMTCGVKAVALLPLPLRLRLAICAATVFFGGGSVLLQTASNLRISLWRYALIKLLLALFAALLTGALTPLFCPDTLSSAFADRAQMAQNAASLFSVVASAAIGLLSIFLLTYGLAQKKKVP